MLALLTGYKVSAAKLATYEYLYPLEDVSIVEGSQADRKLLVMPKDETREHIVERISDAVQTGRIQNEGKMKIKCFASWKTHPSLPIREKWLIAFHDPIWWVCVIGLIIWIIWISA